ncbi:hypothetical protein [Streptacidiphilus neutrinimicus]|uniref:hypothetical protein n=1 Tax=Streptacidiphilus neutrinimicus TaxID=105420 RepID=UPI0006942FB6|nr:hypothetical protein [Streptacidiphilus neutrinimicus]
MTAPPATRDRGPDRDRDRDRGRGRDQGRGRGRDRDGEQGREDTPESGPVAPASRARGRERPAPAGAAPRLRISRLGVALWAAALLALAAYLWALSRVTPTALDRMGGLGLVSALPPVALVSACVLGVLFFLALNSAVARPGLQLFLLLAAVFALHGAAALVEPVPRFPTAYQHLGFVDYIERTGHTLPLWDARFSWPGFFGLVALLLRAGGVDNPLPVLRWSQVGSQLLCLAALAVLLRSLGLPRRTRWCALWFFVAASWVGQDYFSPQAFTYALYLAFLAVLLTAFRVPEDGRPRESGGRLERTLPLGLLTALFLAAVTAHQLTPFVMIAAAGLLRLTRRTTLSLWFAVLLAALAAGWISLAAEGFWSGHLDTIFGGLGQLGGNVSSGVADRVKGDPAHQAVLYLRVLLSGAWFGLAVLGWWRRRRAGHGERALLVLAFMPFFTLGMQSYGGEIALRVFLFALPGVAPLAACFFYPSTRRPRPGRAMSVSAAGWAVVAVAAFGVARYGNEQFERVTGGEITALGWVYQHDHPSARVLYLGPVGNPTTTPAIPWNQRGMDTIAYVGAAAPLDPADVASLETALGAAGPQSYLIVTSTEGADLTANDGYAADWYARARAALDTDPRMVPVVSVPDAALYRLAAPPPGPAPTDIGVGPVGPLVHWTGWTVAEAGLLAVLAPLLFWYEAVRLRTGAALARRARWGVPLLGAVLVGAFLLAVVERFLTLR